MSAHTATTQRLSITDIQAMKGKDKIVALTAYSAPMAALLDEQIDLFIMGDSLGMVCYGMPSTLPVSLNLMIEHGKTVVRHSARALVVVDMPFGSYQESKEQAFRHAAKLLQRTGCQAVKLEGGAEMVETVAYLCARGIPVMAHIGLMPQHVNQMGGYKYQGRSDEAARALLAQAQAFEQAGAFALLLEGVKEEVAAAITQAARIPTIGIGASPTCDGQVLVSEDLLGLTPHPPRFAKRYANLDDIIRKAVSAYAADVRQGTFPDKTQHCFGVKKPS